MATAVNNFSETRTLSRDVQNPSIDELSRKIVKATQSCLPCLHYASLQRDLRQLKPEQLNQLLKTVILDVNEQGMDTLAQLLPLQPLQDAIRTEYPLHISALQSAKEMFQKAQYFIHTTESKISPTLCTRLSGIFRSIISILESLLNAFGIADFFKPADNAIASEFKAQKILMLLTLFTTMSTILIPLLGAEMASIILGGTLLTISALSIIYPYIKPASAKLPRAENWSQQYREGNLLTSGGRKATLDEIAKTLISSKLAKTHVMMIGKTGIGKTETAKAFVEAVERGDYPELKGKEIHYFNTAELLGSTEMFSNANKILSQISEAMGKHRENYILIFDEIHMACQKKENSVLSEQLKTLLDAGKENFPYVIGITTEEEFLREIYVNNAAFARRFKCIALENTDDVETIKILNNVFLKQAPTAFLAPDALQTLLQKTKMGLGQEAAQPGSSLKILSQCIKRIETPKKSTLAARIEKLRNQLQAIHSEAAVGHGNGIPLYSKPSNESQIQEKLQKLEIQFAKEQEELTRLQQDRVRLAKVKTDTYKSVLRVARTASTTLSNSDQKQCKAFLLQSHFLAPLLEKRIRTAAEKHGLKITLDADLIDEVITEEALHRQKAQAAVERGKAQISSRAGA